MAGNVAVVTKSRKADNHDESNIQVSVILEVVEIAQNR